MPKVGDGSSGKAKVGISLLWILMSFCLIWVGSIILEVSLFVAWINMYCLSKSKSF